MSAHHDASLGWNDVAGRLTPPLALVNESTKAAIARDVQLAVSRGERRRGLLGRRHLDPGAALVLTPCFAVHTAGMRFPIDVVFVNRQGVAVRVVGALRPWRLAIAAGAHAVIELPAGTAARHDVRPGDRVSLVFRDEEPHDREGLTGG